MYLFDTDTLVNILKKRPSEKLILKLSNLEKKYQFISAVTIGEICYGAFKSENAAYHLEKLKTALLPNVNILSFDSSAAFYYGKIRAELESEGKIISNTDIEIAATAIANNLILITANTKHFERIRELQIENWI